MNQKRQTEIRKWVRLPKDVVRTLERQAQEENRSWANLAEYVLINHARRIERTAQEQSIESQTLQPA